MPIKLFAIFLTLLLQWSFVSAHVSIANICAGSDTCTINQALAQSTANNAPIANDAPICFHTLGSQYMNTATWTAGQPLKVSFTKGQYGVAHGGGHCQFSLSYDGGKTFVVIHQVLSNCFFASIDAAKAAKAAGTANTPQVSDFSFNLPSGLPSSDSAIFAWSWVNAVGNREYYVNCLKVSIKGTASSFTGNKTVVANHNGGPTIPEFNGDYTVGLQYYNSAPSITVKGNGSTGNAPASSPADLPSDTAVKYGEQGASSTVNAPPMSTLVDINRAIPSPRKCRQRPMK
ncbi:hypothetical protein GGI25_005506 [Coemansia spiralis]|uniref:Chitin-binding type-4 domain-containing protein n=2 Tax=Coemansia TaxID=4863 RepID=A0A9W8G346_9FUNG|nr:hypothetical protein BX070DRAFT_233489 [Coemansia spiralis]KAJ1987965.1 hypothetical protein EDC05_005558 [Coemansia umbellata]KAJ2619524.1 hypothetical protein GGI26_005762 [Coemansia sp. RSA 1358]KAJ2671388.1 hypothetical protein GGI25_005506 [Coemansia spiralis]